MGFWDSYSSVQSAQDQHALVQLAKQQQQNDSAGQAGAWGALTDTTPAPGQSSQSGGLLSGLTGGGGLGGLLGQVGAGARSLVGGGGAQPAGGGGGSPPPPPMAPANPTPPPGAPPQQLGAPQQQQSPVGTPAPGGAPAPPQQPQVGTQPSSTPAASQPVQGQGGYDLATMVKQIDRNPNLQTPQAKMAALGKLQPYMNQEAKQQYQSELLRMQQGRLDATNDRNDEVRRNDDLKDDNKKQELQIRQQQADQKQSQFDAKQAQLENKFLRSQDKDSKAAAIKEIRENQKAYFAQAGEAIRAQAAGLTPEQIKAQQLDLTKQREEADQKINDLLQQDRKGGSPDSAPSSTGSAPASTGDGKLKPIDDATRARLEEIKRSHPDQVQAAIKYIKDQGGDVSGL